VQALRIFSMVSEDSFRPIRDIQVLEASFCISSHR
jgi:hypothetical protein